MPIRDQKRRSQDPDTTAHLLGTVDFQRCLALQQRLVYESDAAQDGRITLLLSEHPACVTVGRAGSRTHVRLAPRELERRGWRMAWVNRGGGCLVHSPGQLAVYPIVPLSWHGWTVGEYLRRLQGGLYGALAEAGFASEPREGRFGLWARSGQLAAVGVAVKNWITYYGAYVNVNPELGRYRAVMTDAIDGTTMSSLAVERRKRVRMTTIREAVARHLAAAFDASDYHVHTGHPGLPAPEPVTRSDEVRVG